MINQLAGPLGYVIAGPRARARREPRPQAQALVMAGRVPAASRSPGTQVDEGAADLDLERPPAVRLARQPQARPRARRAQPSTPRASTRSTWAPRRAAFTDVLLQRGARRVTALDVGYGQLHSRLRDDPRVSVLERTNARELRELPTSPRNLVTCDVSFISAKLALPPALHLARPGWHAFVLVKPHRKRAGPRVRVASCATPRSHARVIREVAEALLASGESRTAS